MLPLTEPRGCCPLGLCCCCEDVGLVFVDVVVVVVDIVVEAMSCEVSAVLFKSAIESSTLND